MTVANKTSKVIAFLRDPGFIAPDNGNQATRFLLIPDSELYTNFSVQLVSDGAAALDSILTSLEGPKFVAGVSGAASGNTITPPTYYQSVLDLNSNQVLTMVPGYINEFTLSTPMKGGVVLGVVGISSDANTIRVAMWNSAFSASL